MTDTAATTAQTTETEATKKDKASKAATPPAPPEASQLAPTGPRESPTQKSWRERREQLSHIVDTLVHGDPSDPSSPMKRQGATLMAAHIAIDDKRAHKGLPKTKTAAEMSPKQILEYAAIFRSRYPGAWGAANRCDVANFMRFLGIAGLRGWSESEEGDADIQAEEMVVFYQSAMSQLG
jgi:hypothetical protein